MGSLELIGFGELMTLPHIGNTEDLGPPSLVQIIWKHLGSVSGNPTSGTKSVILAITLGHVRETGTRTVHWQASFLSTEVLGHPGWRSYSFSCLK